MSRSAPLVSIALPVHNGDRTVAEAVRSVLAQTYAKLELIVCDDGSTDSTVGAVRAFGDKRICLLRHYTARGPGPARDHAISAARGDWLAVIDADDAWVPDRLEKLLAATGEDDVMVFDDLMLCHDTREGMVPWRALRGARAFAGNGHQPVDVAIEALLAAPRMLIKPLIPRRLVETSGARHGTWTFGEDAFFLLQLLAARVPLRYLPQPLYMYRITPGSLTSASGREAQMLAILEAVRPLFPESSSACAALEHKMRSVRRLQRYYELLDCLKAGRITALTREFRSLGWFLPMLVRKLGADWPYLLDAYRSNARRRFRH